MNPRVLLGIAVVILLGVGGLIGYMELQRRNKPKPPPPPPVEETPAPVDPEAEAKREAARTFEECNQALATDAGNSALYHKRAKSIFKAKEALPHTPEQRAEMAITDLLHAIKLGITTGEIYDDIVLAAKWINSCNKLEQAVKEAWFKRTLEVLDAGCDAAKPAHAPRVDFITWRFTAHFAPKDAEAVAWRERELASLDALLQTDATADRAERAGDLAKEFGKLNKAMTYFKKAVELDPKRKDRVDEKMK